MIGICRVPFRQSRSSVQPGKNISRMYLWRDALKPFYSAAVFAMLLSIS